MQFKHCFKCGKDKPLDAFYKHAQMSDGKLGKCKECTCADVRANRLAKADYYREFDRLRASQPRRVAARKEYAKTPEGKAAHIRASQVSKLRFPLRRRARVLLGNAVRDGRVEKLPCFVCGADAEGHHPDYSRPLDVVWLCNEHHRAAHNAAHMQEAA